MMIHHQKKSHSQFHLFANALKLFFGSCSVVMVIGCSTPPSPKFKDQPIIWKIDDQSDIPMPEETEFFAKANMARVYVTRRLTRYLEFPSHKPAQNVNALEEVPDSSWFTNRIGQEKISSQRMVQGPLNGKPPLPPFTIFKGKSLGSNPGFFAKDSLGRSFLVKFDTPENPEMQTGTNSIVGRFFWALGYNIPEDYLVRFSKQDLVLDPKASLKNKLLEKIPMTERHLNEVLAKVPSSENGTYRATFSQWLDGRPLGGFSAEGVRNDDPNDKIPHQHRRELRGLKVFSSWLGHTDMKIDNTLDMYVEENGRKFVKHYLLDFGEALGAHQAEKGRMEDGWEYGIDWEYQLKALLSLGIWVRPWENQKNTPWLAIGAFSATHYEPQLWREVYPYWPFFEMDAVDAYWATKKILLFDRSLIEAAVSTGEFSEPAASRYLVDTLIERQRKVAEYYLAQVSPADWFSFESHGYLCLTDLAAFYGVSKPATLLVRQNQKEEKHSFSPQGTVCFLPQRDQDYLVVQLNIQRENMILPALELHLKTKEENKILGLIRHGNKLP